MDMYKTGGGKKKLILKRRDMSHQSTLSHSVLVSLWVQTEKQGRGGEREERTVVTDSC